ncbi:MAG: hypothetical protein ACM3TN_22890 [Alphaproteobacteria bacterium]
MLDDSSQTVELSRPRQVETVEGSEDAARKRRGFFKGPLGMAICCGGPLLLLAAISVFGLSLGAIASGALSLAAVLACPVAMYFMMRNMSKK